MARTRFSYVFDDGGRKAAGFDGYTGDCVARSIAILTRRRYAAVYEHLNMVTEIARGKGYHLAYSHSGVSLGVYKAYLTARGWRYVHLDRKGQKPKYLCVEDMPKTGRFLARVEMEGDGCKHHVVTVINGVAHDNSHKIIKPRRVLGYFVRKRRRRRKGRN